MAQRTALDSSVIKAYAYDNERQILEIEFPDQRVRHYIGVPVATVHEMLNAPSIGRYYNAVIKANTAFESVEGPMPDDLRFYIGTFEAFYYSDRRVTPWWTIAATAEEAYDSFMRACKNHYPPPHCNQHSAHLGPLAEVGADGVLLTLLSEKGYGEGAQYHLTLTPIAQEKFVYRLYQWSSRHALWALHKQYDSGEEADKDRRLLYSRVRDLMTELELDLECRLALLYLTVEQAEATDLTLTDEEMLTFDKQGVTVPWPGED